jgi:hypothetical protein
LAVIAACGGLYGGAAAKTPWGLTNPVAMFALCFPIAFCSIHAARLGKLRNTVVAWVYGLAGLVLFTAASMLVMQRLAGHTGSVWEFMGQRRRDGIVLFGGFALKGVWVVAAWVLNGLVTLFVTTAPYMEAQRPFCDGCKAWGWKPRWRFRLIGPSEGDLAQLRAQQSLEALTRISRGGDRKRVLDCALGVCRCGNVAALTVELKTQGSEQADATLIQDLPMYPGTAQRLYQWAERLDPTMAERRPKINPLKIEDSGSGAIDLAYPEGEPKTSFRWSGRQLACDCTGDNALTKALRKHIQRDGPGIIPRALSMAKNHDDLAYIAEACADWDTRPGWIERWTEAAPDSAEMHLIRGIQSVKWAWHARGGGWVPKNYAVFQDRLAEAQHHLHAAAQGRPDDPTPWAWLIYAAKGRGEEKDAVFGLFKQAIRRSPFHRQAHSFMADAITPKWGGSAGKLHEFARKASARAPAGSAVHVVLAEAHLELAADRARETEDKDGLRAYLGVPEVQRELREANAKAFQVGAFTPSMDTPRNRAMWAYTLWKAGLSSEAGEHLRLMGRSSAWGPFSPNIPFLKDSVRRARRECGV